MSDWMVSKVNHPHLTRDEEEHFMRNHGLPRKQVKVPFNNRRQPIVPPLRLNSQLQMGEIPVER
jgi:hypothetical protein